MHGKQFEEEKRRLQVTERTTEDYGDGHVVTTEKTMTEEHEKRSYRELLIANEQAFLKKLPEIFNREVQEFQTRQLLANDAAIIRYRFRWIHEDILRHDNRTPLPIFSPAKLRAKGIPYVIGPELIWIPLYLRATSPKHFQGDIPELTMIHDFEQRGDNEELWAFCDFEWEDGGDTATRLWIPELLLRSYPPYVPLLNEVSRDYARQICEEQAHYAEKRIELVSPRPVATPTTETLALPAPPVTPPKKLTEIYVPNWQRLNDLAENPQLCLTEVEAWRQRQAKNLLEPKVAAILNPLPLVDQLKWVGDAELVILRCFIAAFEGDCRLPIILTANYVHEDKIRIAFRDLPGYPVWMPAAFLYWAASLCRCPGGMRGGRCSCRWRDVWPAFDVLEQRLAG